MAAISRPTEVLKLPPLWEREPDVSRGETSGRPTLEQEQGCKVNRAGSTLILSDIADSTVVVPDRPKHHHTSAACEQVQKKQALCHLTLQLLSSRRTQVTTMKKPQTVFAWEDKSPSPAAPQTDSSWAWSPCCALKLHEKTEAQAAT